MASRPGGAVRRPLHAGEPHLRRLHRLHRAGDGGALARRPAEQGGRCDGRPAWSARGDFIIRRASSTAKGPSSATSIINRTPSGAWWRRPSPPQLTAGGAAGRSANISGTATTSSVPKPRCRRRRAGWSSSSRTGPSGQTTPSLRAARAGDRHRFRRRAEPPIGDRFGCAARCWKRQHLAETTPRQTSGRAGPATRSSTGSAATARSGSGCWGTAGCSPTPAWSCRGGSGLRAPATDGRLARGAGGSPEGEPDQRRHDAGRSGHRHHARDLGDVGSTTGAAVSSGSRPTTPSTNGAAPRSPSWSWRPRRSSSRSCLLRFAMSL